MHEDTTNPESSSASAELSSENQRGPARYQVPVPSALISTAPKSFFEFPDILGSDVSSARTHGSVLFLLFFIHFYALMNLRPFVFDVKRLGTDCWG